MVISIHYLIVKEPNLLTVTFSISHLSLSVLNVLPAVASCLWIKSWCVAEWRWTSLLLVSLFLTVDQMHRRSLLEAAVMGSGVMISTEVMSVAVQSSSVHRRLGL